MSERSHWLDGIQLVIAGHCLPSVLTNWSFSLTPRWSLSFFFPSLLEPAVSVYNATSPWASLRLRRDNNWKQIPGPVWRFHTDRTQSPCLSESAEERGFSKHHIPGVATRYVGGLDGLPCRKNWPRKQRLPCQALFPGAPRRCSGRQTKKGGKRKKGWMFAPLRFVI